jgi:ribosomal protein S18 acetylase RimI-like enzyme
MDLQYDLIREDEADALVAMVRAHHAADDNPHSPYFETAIVGIAKGEPMARAWLVRHGNRVVGYVVLTLGYSIEYGGRDGFIDDLYLVPDARGRGWGRMIVDFALAEAARLGIRVLHLEVEANNDRASSLYRLAGFEETGRRLMRRRLQP